MFKEMKTYAHLKPGQKGTRRLVETYGEKLLCVRYRYDEKRGVKVKTVEIIVDEKPLRHPRYNDDDIVPVSVAFDETELRDLLKRIRAAKTTASFSSLPRRKKSFASTSDTGWRNILRI